MFNMNLLACPAHSAVRRNLVSLFRIIIVDQKLAILAEPVGLGLGNVNDIKGATQAMHVVENLVHLLERATGCLRVEEVHTRYHEGIDDGKDHVGPPLDVGKRGWRHHDHLIKVRTHVADAGISVQGEKRTMKLNIQLAVVDIAFAGALIGRGVISAG
jgi:hypothetical protein